MKKWARRVKKRLNEGVGRKLPKWFIVGLYTLGQRIFTNYGKRKRSMYNVIYELNDEAARNPKLAKQLFKEIQYCRFLYGISAREYFIFRFDMLSDKGRRTYVSRAAKNRFYRKFNTPGYMDYLNKKTETYRIFKDFYKRDVACIYDEEDYPEFLAFIEKHDSFIYKPVDDHGGHGVAIYNVNDFTSKDDLFAVVLAGGCCVLEELIKQSDVLGQFHPKSVNTVRIVTFLKGDGEPVIQWCFLRIGEGDSHTDNMSSGGIAGMIDPETGVICESGRSWDGSRCVYHPDTGIKIPGFTMPDWDGAKKMIKELCNRLPQVRFIGWDLAYTDNGWVLVEGNARPQCGAPQVTEFNGMLAQYQAADDIFEAEIAAGQSDFISDEDMEN